MSDLVICRLSDASASVAGGREIILLCEKITKDDIQVRFFEEKDGICIWEGFGDFQPSDVHKQVAIHFRTPKYKTMQVDYPVNLWIQLRRPTDGMCSEARQFLFTPVDSDPAVLKRKRQKISSESDLLRQLQSDPRLGLMSQSSNYIENIIEPISIKVPIKQEPETSPNPYIGGLFPLSNSTVLGQPSPMYNSRTPSPMEYQFPNVNSNSFYGQSSLTKINVNSSTGNQTSGCIITQVNALLNSPKISQTTCTPPIARTITPIPCPTDDIPNEPNLVTFSSLDRLDSSDLRDLSTMMDAEQVLSANLSASLHLEEGNIPLIKPCIEMEAQDTSMSDSFDRIANNTLNEFCEIYTKRN